MLLHARVTQIGRDNTRLVDRHAIVFVQSDTTVYQLQSHHRKIHLQVQDYRKTLHEWLVPDTRGIIVLQVICGQLQ